MKINKYPVPENMDHLVQILSSFTNYEKSRDFHKGRIRFDLNKMNDLLCSLGDPHLKTPAIHITGSKGKGSTAAMIAEILNAHGLKVGLYTSPHLERMNERIAINRAEISDESFLSASDKVLDVLRKNSDLKPTFFEFITTAAMAYFHSMKVEAAVYEVGLGGRLDCTNVLKPEASVITTVELEHCAVLGNTKKEIALEKCGIIKHRVPVICALPDGCSAREVVNDYARKMESPMLAPGRGLDLIYQNNEVFVELEGEKYGPINPPPPAELQAWNAACALGVSKTFMERVNRTWKKESAIAALNSVKLPGRFEIFHRKPQVIVDSAHTPESILASMTEANSMRKRPLVTVVGFAEDKDVDEALHSVLRYSDEVVFTAYPGGRAVEPKLLKEKAQGIGFLSNTPEDAVDVACKTAGDDGLVLVTGSFYLAGAVRKCLV